MVRSASSSVTAGAEARLRGDELIARSGSIENLGCGSGIISGGAHMQERLTKALGPMHLLMALGLPASCAARSVPPIHRTSPATYAIDRLILAALSGGSLLACAPSNRLGLAARRTLPAPKSPTRATMK